MTKVYNDSLDLGVGGCYLWQYDKASNLSAILNKELEFYDINVTQFWKNFYRDVFNIDTANDFGLSIWGATLGIPRPEYEDGGQTYLFSTEQYRKLLKGALLLMMSTASIHDINAYLNDLFPNKPVFAADTHNMTLVINFFYEPSADEQVLINYPDFFPRPAGVELRINTFQPDTILGFDGSGLQSFDNGVFWV